MASLAQRLLQLPYFLFAIFIFFWSPALGCIAYRIRFASAGPRKDIYEWSTGMFQFFGIRPRKLGQQPLYKGGRCVYLCNHRSWADFFVDVHLTEALAAPMSRTMVFFAFPVFMSIVVVLKGILLFKRGVIADKQKFNKWLDDQLDGSPVQSLLVYPEGHRSTKDKSLPLKRGMMYYAHGRGLPVQIIITAGKERVLSEKRMTASYGQTLVTSFSEPIQSKDYPDFEKFSAEVQRTWDAMWEAVYSADPKGLPPLPQDGVPGVDFPSNMRNNMLIVSLTAILLLLVVLAASGYAIRAVLALLPGPLQVAVIVVTITWFIASCIACAAKDGGASTIGPSTVSGAENGQHLAKSKTTKVS